jgi:Fe2+ transport system protein FeoA
MTAVSMAMRTTTLERLEKAATATVVGFVAGDEDAVRKLLALGIVPGDRLRVLARRPACLFEVGSARYALDRELAARVLVTEDDNKPSALEPA